MYIGPFCPTPVTDLFALLTPNYRLLVADDFCAKLTMRFYDCLEAHGTSLGREKCRDLFFDSYECRNRIIQSLRTREILKERQRKYKAGEIKEKYNEPPPKESYFHI